MEIIIKSGKKAFGDNVIFENINMKFEKGKFYLIKGYKMCIRDRVRYDAQEELLKKRLVAVYNKGNISYLNVLLGANNFIEFLSLYTAVSQIAKYDKSQLDLSLIHIFRNGRKR